MKSVMKENAAWIEETWEKLDKKLSRTAVKSRGKLPYTTVNGVHDDKKDTNLTTWTNGFWGGMMWLMYKGTGREDYKITAECSETLMDGALENYKMLHHDVGFMWHILSGANYRLTGNQRSLNRNLAAAASLAARFNIDGGYIRAWNGPWEEGGNQGWSIIDCMMNIPLLYWASEEIGDPRFKRIAMAHADMTLRDHIRADGSINHIVEHDTETGEAVRVHGGQGCSETSCWSRGQAWAVYGTILSYIHTGEKRYLDAAVKTANYFIANCRANGYLPVIDFRAPLEPMYFDSTAGVCAACGILETAKYVSPAEGRMYTQAAVEMLKAIDRNFCNYSGEEDSVVQMGSERYPLNDMKGVHIPIIYGDFFFAEAMLKLIGCEFLIW